MSEAGAGRRGEWGWWQGCVVGRCCGVLSVTVQTSGERQGKVLNRGGAGSTSVAAVFSGLFWLLRVQGRGWGSRGNADAGLLQSVRRTRARCGSAQLVAQLGEALGMS